MQETQRSGGWRGAVTWRRFIILWLGLAVFSAGVLVGQGRTGVLRDVSLSQRTELPTSFDYAQVDDVYQALRNNYDGKLTREQVLNGLKHGLAESTKDPYTEFFTASEAQDFSNDLQGTISGIGARLELDQEGNVVIVAPLDGSPAEAAGLRAKDVIIAIDEKSTSGMTATEAVLKIRGKKGTKVAIKIKRYGESELLAFEIIRDKIPIYAIAAQYMATPEIGYVKLERFSATATEETQAAIDSLRKLGAKKIILDLTSNGGG